MESSQQAKVPNRAIEYFAVAVSRKNGCIGWGRASTQQESVRIAKGQVGQSGKWDGLYVLYEIEDGLEIKIRQEGFTGWSLHPKNAALFYQEMVHKAIYDEFQKKIRKLETVDTKKIAA